MRVAGSSIVEVLVALALSTIAIGGGVAAVATLTSQMDARAGVVAELALANTLADPLPHGDRLPAGGFRQNDTTATDLIIAQRLRPHPRLPTLGVREVRVYSLANPAIFTEGRKLIVLSSPSPTQRAAR